MGVEPLDSGDVLVDVDGPVATVVLNRPAKRNALTQDMYRILADTLEAADGDLGISVVTITGSEGAFTAGNDLADFASAASLDQTVRFLDVVSIVRVPVVAAVNGLAIGVGLTMLLHCDLVYVEPEAKLSVPFTSLGLVPEAASSLLLPRLVGPRRAAELLLTGRSLTGVEAAEWGLCTGTASPAIEAARAAAQQLAALPPQALRTTKALLRSDDQTVAGRMSEEMRAFSAALRGTEFAEVMQARSERRPPVFGR